STPSVVANDTLDGSPVVIGTNPGQVTLTGVTVPAGLTLNADGTITVNPNTASGTYTVVYEICEVGANPVNCEQGTVTVVVNNPIVANNDTPAAIAVGDSTPSVVANDTLDGSPVVIGTNPGQVALTGVTVPAGLTLNADGTITVNANTPSGTYTVVYEICEVGANPVNCEQGTVTVVVNNRSITAGNDILPATGGNVLTNDTLNGQPVIPTNIAVTPATNGPLSIDAQGNVTVAANTPSGTYTIMYQICETGANPVNCTTAMVTIVINNPIIANDVVIPPTGGNVTNNDTLNGNRVSAANTDVTPVTDGPLSIDADGNLTVAPNTTAGTYTIRYQICEVGANPANCTTALATVVIAETPMIAIIKTAVFNDENSDGFAQAGETITYRFEVTNTGNVVLNNVVVTDNLPGLTLTGGPIAILGINETNTTAYTGVYPLKQSDINLGSVSNQAQARGTTPLGIVVTDLSDDSNMLEDRPTVLGVNGCQIEVFNAVIPNGEGDNKIFRVRGLECYQDNRVEIYNRWGVLVFERNGYNNDDRAFRGVSEGRVTVKQSEELPEGTYYYILKYKDSVGNNFEKAGYLYINR
ncbi:MAG: gliding motility-associated C-terminal domain-containing protein, partial [Flavobacterium sp.]